MPPTIVDQVNAQSRAIRQISTGLKQALALAQQLAADVVELKQRPRTITEEIDAIPGRRIESIFSGEIDFNASDAGKVGLPIVIQISQDGPFIQTHYPMLLWYPTGPADTQNLGAWRPVASYPLPTQEVSGDIIDVKYEILDAGAQRMFQDTPRGPILSRPDNIVPLACPTEWSSNSSIQVRPTYQRIAFTGSGDQPVPPTSGRLYCALIGYRCVNL